MMHGRWALGLIGGICLLGGLLVSTAQAEITLLAQVRPFYYGNGDGHSDPQGSQVCATVTFTPFALNNVLSTEICASLKAVNAKTLCPVLTARMLAVARMVYPTLYPLRAINIAVQGCNDALEDAAATR